MDALWIKRGNSLVPADPVTEELLSSVKNGDHVTTSSPRKRRNPSFHKYMMALLQLTLENARGDFADLDDLMFYLKVKSGMFKEIDTRFGVRLVPKSISFASMDQLKFRRVADLWRFIITTDENLLPGTDPDSLLEEFGETLTDDQYGFGAP